MLLQQIQKTLEKITQEKAAKKSSTSAKTLFTKLYASTKSPSDQLQPFCEEPALQQLLKNKLELQAVIDKTSGFYTPAIKSNAVFLDFTRCNFNNCYKDANYKIENVCNRFALTSKILYIRSCQEIHKIY